MSNSQRFSQSDVQQQEQFKQNLSNQKNDTNFEFNQPSQLKDYFKSFKTSSVSQKKSNFYTYQRYINTVQQIYNDETYLNSKPLSIDHLLVKDKINQEQQKANQLKAKKIQILHQLSLLDDQVSRTKRLKSHSKDKINLSMDVSRISSKDNAEDNDLSQEKNIKKLILSKEQHKQLMMKIVKQREERDKHKLMLREKEQQRLRKIQEQHKLIEMKKHEQEKKRKADEIEEKLKKKKEIHQKFIQTQKQSLKKVQQLKQKKFLHQEIEEKFQLNVKLPLLQEQKKILKEKRQFAKAYSIDQIKTHERAYLELRQSSMKKSQAIQPLKSFPEGYKAPLKSSRLEKILEEEKLENRKKLMQKKRAIEEKLQRQQNYVEYLKENFSKVKIDNSKAEEIKSRLEKEQVKRQEFDTRSIGINYLQEAKKLRRKTAQPLKQAQHEETAIDQNKANITILSQQQKRQKILSQSRIADDIRRDRLTKKRQQKIHSLINDKSIDQKERIKKLKIETDKINEAFKMKQEMLRYGYNQKVEDEAVELLLSSIQAKMGIIDISKEKEKEGLRVRVE